MSSTASRTYPIVHVTAYDSTVPLWAFGCESLSEALEAREDGKWVVMGQLGGSLGRLVLRSSYDGLIPPGATLTGVNLSISMLQMNAEDGQAPSPVKIFGVFDDESLRDLTPLQGLLSFTSSSSWGDRFDLKDWEEQSADFTATSAGAFIIGEIPLYSFQIGPIASVPSGAMGVDYGEVTFSFTLSAGSFNVLNTKVNRTTPYAAYVQGTVQGVGEMFNSIYPLTAWFEWTRVDPTNADTTTIPISTTPVQTFTATRDITDRNVRFYDTLPSPLDVQNPRESLSPNTTYWWRGVASLNGETVYSDWMSFTTPLNDEILL